MHGRLTAPVALLLGLTVLGCGRAAARGPAQLPAGWVVIAPPDTSYAWWFCANWFRDDWRVRLSDDSALLLIARDSGRADEKSVIEAGGEMKGWNNGEFGGGIIWQPLSGSPDTISRRHLVAFVPVGHQLLALVGLGHLGMEYGSVLRLEKRPGGGWRADSIMDLGSTPTAFTRLGGDSILVATTRSLMALSAPEKPHVLHPSGHGWEYANSLVRDRAGVIYLGMREAVARLTPAGGGYREDWVVPACPRGLKTGKESGPECRCVLADSTSR